MNLTFMFIFKWKKSVNWEFIELHSYFNIDEKKIVLNVKSYASKIHAQFILLNYIECVKQNEEKNFIFIILVGISKKFIEKSKF